MQTSFYKVLLTSVILAMSLCTFAYNQLEQTGFSKRSTRDGGMQFAYKWRLGDENYSLSFDLNQAQIVSLPLTAPRFNNKMLNREVEVALKRHAVLLAERGIKATVKRQAREISYSVSATTQSSADLAIRELQGISETSTQEFYERYYLVNFTDHLNRNFVQNDYVKYANESAEGLQPIVEAIKALQRNSTDKREFTALAMTWLQSIPYNDLLSRSDSNGAGFFAPIDLLRRNKGDCDSKSTLLATLLKAYDPTLAVYMVLLPQHALLAVDIPAQNNEQTLLVNGKDMLLIEPTGPAYFAKGKVDDKSALAILNRQYETLEF